MISEQFISWAGLRASVLSMFYYSLMVYLARMTGDV